MDGDVLVTISVFVVSIVGRVFGESPVALFGACWLVCLVVCAGNFGCPFLCGCDFLFPFVELVVDCEAVDGVVLFGERDGCFGLVLVDFDFDSLAALVLGLPLLTPAPFNGFRIRAAFLGLLTRPVGDALRTAARLL